ncbi:MAG: hypothetical protein AAB604_00920 [Patescibacteria group bacterium]|jgi:hypothetical protein
MSNSIVFPYGITLQENNKISLFPAAEVGFFNAKGELLTLLLLIDSGATISALPKSDAAVFGIIAEKGIPILIAGIGKDMVEGWQHTIKVKLGKKIIMIPFLFLDNDFAPRLLGRAGFFEKHLVIFEEQKRRSGVMPVVAKEARLVSNIVDKLME